MFIYVQYKMKQELEMQILLREVSIVLKLSFEIILLKFKLNKTFRCISVGVVLTFRFKIILVMFFNKTLVSGAGL